MDLAALARVARTDLAFLALLVTGTAALAAGFAEGWWAVAGLALVVAAEARFPTPR